MHVLMWPLYPHNVTKCQSNGSSSVRENIKNAGTDRLADPVFSMFFVVQYIHTYVVLFLRITLGISLIFSRPVRVSPGRPLDPRRDRPRVLRTGARPLPLGPVREHRGRGNGQEPRGLGGAAPDIKVRTNIVGRV